MVKGSIYEDEIRLLTRNIILEKENARLRDTIKWQESRIKILADRKYKFLLHNIIKQCKLHKK